MNHKLFFSSLLFSFTLPAAYAIDLSGQVTNQVNRTVSSGVAKNLFDNLIIPELKVRNASGKIKQMRLTADQRFLSLILADGTARVWDLELGIQRPMISCAACNRISIAAPQQLAFVANAASIESYDVLTANRTNKLDLKANTIDDVQISKEGSLLAVSADKQLSLWDTKTQKKLWQQNDFANPIDAITLDDNNRYLAVMTGNALEVREIKTGKKLPVDLPGFKNLEGLSTKIIFSQFGANNTLEVGYSNGEVSVWNLQTGTAISSRKLDATLVAMDKTNGVYAYVLDNGKVLVTDAQGNNKASIAKEGSAIQAVALVSHGQKLMTATDKGQIFLWNIADGKELLQLISTQQGWTVLDSSGRFDSSEQGMPNVSWQAGTEEIPFDNITTKYYEPGLLASALKDDSYLIAQPNVILQGVTLPPKLNLTIKEIKATEDEAELTVDVYDQGGGIENVDLFHNAKVVSSQRSVIDEKKLIEQDKEHRIMTLKVKPTPGKNQIKVVASNKLGIEANSAEMSFDVNLASKQPTLRVATIGIDKYKDRQLNLDYSVADAESIDKLLSEKKLVKFASFNNKKLYNKEATKLSILSVLRELSQGAQEDVLAIYFAGHGISIKGEWYFLPYETTLEPDWNYFATVGISATELSDIFKDSTIQHILLMVDSCYSGASLDSFRKLQNSQRRFSRIMSRSVGITVVTATRKDQQAAELSDLGHGLFTYVLEKGMRGEADVTPKNNQISAHELADFSTKTIPGFSKKYLGAAQEPSSFTMGHDFVLFDNQ